jgi:hypothetical protein
MGSVFSVFYTPPPPRTQFVAEMWVGLLKEAVLDIVNRSEMALKYSEIGDRLGLNETCISGKKFKDSLMMNVVEDLVQNQQIKWSTTVGRPFVESV